MYTSLTKKIPFPLQNKKKEKIFTTSKQLKRGKLEILPPEIVIKIFLYLKISTIIHVGFKINKNFHNILHKESLWYQVVNSRKFSNEKEKNETYFELFKRKFKKLKIVFLYTPYKGDKDLQIIKREFIKCLPANNFEDDCDFCCFTKKLKDAQDWIYFKEETIESKRNKEKYIGYNGIKVKNKDSTTKIIDEVNEEMYNEFKKRYNCIIIFGGHYEFKSRFKLISMIERLIDEKNIVVLSLLHSNCGSSSNLAGTENEYYMKFRNLLKNSGAGHFRLKMRMKISEKINEKKIIDCIPLSIVNNYHFVNAIQAKLLINPNQSRIITHWESNSDPNFLNGEIFKFIAIAESLNSRYCRKLLFLLKFFFRFKFFD